MHTVYGVCAVCCMVECGMRPGMVHGGVLLFEVFGLRCVVFCQPCEDLVAPSACVGRVLVCVLIRSLETLDVALLTVATSLFMGYFSLACV